jgi:hypothetical protein
VPPDIRLKPSPELRCESENRVLVVVPADHFNALGDEQIKRLRGPRAEIDRITEVEDPVAAVEVGAADRSLGERQVCVNVREYRDAREAPC